MNFTNHAKCIISGEHAVLRGSHAIAFPIKNLSLNARFIKQDNFTIDFEGIHSSETKALFWLAMDRALDVLNKTRADLKGGFVIDNDIPIGSGLGASASFCVLVAKICINFNWINKEEAFSFAKNLEDIFHGESSGLDVAVSLNDKGIYFHREEGYKELDSKWTPPLYLSYSGSRGLTVDCVRKVKELWSQDAKKAENIDLKMKKSVAKIFNAFTNSQDVWDLKEGLDIGLSCFQDWNLVNANLREHIQSLRDQGALALKPTGSGNGGYILSLWPEGKKPDIASGISLF